MTCNACLNMEHGRCEKPLTCTCTICFPHRRTVSVGEFCETVLDKPETQVAADLFEWA